MLSLYIGPRKRKAVEATGWKFTIFPLYYEKDGDLHEIRYSTSLPPLDDVEIRACLWRFFIRLPVSEKLRNAILNFMIFKHVQQDDSFDCYSFACWYAGVPPESKTDIPAHWWLAPLRRVRRGDVVFLFVPQDEYVHFGHAAVYLGFGRYLSVLGGGGQFEVATLKDMEKDWGTTCTLRAIPR